MSNQNLNAPAKLAARETQLTQSINSHYQALVSFEEARTALAEAQAKVSELTKQVEIRNNQLEALKSEYNVVATKASAFGWFIENLSAEIPAIPNTTIDSHVTSRIVTEFQNHKIGEKHLANMSLVNFAYGIHEAPVEPDVPEIQDTSSSSDSIVPEKQLNRGLGNKTHQAEELKPEATPESRPKNVESVKIKHKTK